MISTFLGTRKSGPAAVAPRGQMDLPLSRWEDLPEPKERRGPAAKFDTLLRQRNRLCALNQTRSSHRPRTRVR